MKQILCLLFLVPLCISSTISRWNLSIKNEKINDSPIILIPGIFTKVTFVLENADGKTFDNSEDEKVINFEIELDDKEGLLATAQSSYTLTPTNSLEFTGYVGLRCGATLKDTSLDLKFKVKAVKNEDGTTTTDGELNIASVKVNISKEKAKLDIDTVLSKISAQAYSLFKINKEPFNIDDIKLVVDASADTEGEYTFPEIVLKKFDELRALYSPEDPVNNGILFDFKFGIKKILEEIKNTKLKFALKIDTEGLEQCFDLVKKEFNLEVIKEKVASLADKAKQAIKYTLDNISKIHDSFNGLKFQLNIPVAPVQVSCEIRLDTNFHTDEDILNNVDASADVQYYNNIFTSVGQVALKLGKLDASAEYYTKCVFSNTGFLENLKSKISVAIGNFLNADVLSNLKPSRDTNRPPKCAEFEFSNILQVAAFKTIARRYCNYVMTKGEPLLVRLFASDICQIASSSIWEGIISKTATICVAPSPLLNVLNYSSTDEAEKYNENFKQFISDISDSNKILEKIGIKNAVVKSVKEYTDVKPDTDKLSFTVDDSDWAVIFNKDIKFEITSTNDQPIECYYNYNFEEGVKKRFSLLGILANSDGYVKLYPNEPKEIKCQIPKDKLVKNTMYPLYMNCYSLPGFKVKYESTGIFNPYTYYYTGDKGSYVPKWERTAVDCTQKINKINPRCIKSKVQSIVEKLKTDIPKFIEDIQDKVEQFGKMANEAQIEVMKKLNSTVQSAIEKVKQSKENLKTFVEKSIETAKYLANRDCSMYASAKSSTEEDTINASSYASCRNSKKYMLSQIIDVIKEKLQCSTIFETVVSGLSDNPEENLKYLLFLINEVTSSPEALEKGTSQAVYDLANCLKENFEPLWEKVQNYLVDTKSYLNTTVDAIKKDASTILMQTLSNLVNVLHFDEIDGYLENVTDKIEKTGLILNEKAKKVYNDIKDFSKKLINYGNGFYNISGSMAVNVNVNPGVFDADADAEVFVTDIVDKGIKLLLHSNYLLKEKAAYAIQSLVFDSPLVSVKASGELNDNTLSTFIDISLYDKDGNEISVNKIGLENFRPTILYSKTTYKNLDVCVYYDEKTEEFSSEGVETDPNFVYEGEEYVKCSSKHLTSFTLSSTEGTSGKSLWVTLLIILGILIVLVGIIVAFIYIRRKTNSQTDVNINKDSPIFA